MRTLALASGLSLLLSLQAHGQARTLAPDSTFSAILPSPAIRIPTELLGISPKGLTDSAYDLPTRGGRGTQALIGFYSLPYAGHGVAAFADSIRHSRAPTDPQDRAWFFEHPPKKESLMAGVAYSWDGPCGDCTLTEVLVVGEHSAALFLYFYDDQRPVAQKWGHDQLWAILKSVRWSR